MNMLSTLDWLIIISSFLLYVIVGMRYSKTAGKDLDHFFLGGRNMGWFLAGVSLVATTFAADTPLAVAEIVGTNGIAGNWVWWSFLAGGMLTTFFFANLWRRSGVLTEVELIELRYSGKEASFLRGFKAIYLGLLMNAIIIAWVNVAMKSILEVFFNCSSNEALFYTALAMLLVAIYSSISGLMGVAVTDAIQFFIAMTGCIILAIIVISSEKIGGIVGLKEKVNAVSPEAFNFLPSINSDVSSIGKSLGLSIISFLSFVGIQWWASWYPGAEPGGGGYVVQRMMSAKTEKDAVYATLFFQIAHYCIRPWPWILVGLAAIVLYPGLDAEHIKLGYIYAMRDFLPNGLKGLLLVAFFAAYMSTIATQLNWGASYLINDVYKRFLTPAASDRKLVAASRIMTFILMVIGLAITTRIDSISGAWKFVMGCGAGLGLVLILRWYWWRINAWSEIAATITPFVIFSILKIYNNTDLKDYEYIITVIGTTIVWLIITIATPPVEDKHLKHFYDKIKPDGLWGKYAQNHNSTHILYLFICWISGIAFTYSMLFFIGKTILMEWQQAMACAVVAIVSLLSLRFFLNKTNILNG